MNTFLHTNGKPALSYPTTIAPVITTYSPTHIWDKATTLWLLVQNTALMKFHYMHVITCLCKINYIYIYKFSTYFLCRIPPVIPFANYVMHLCTFLRKCINAVHVRPNMCCSMGIFPFPVWSSIIEQATVSPPNHAATTHAQYRHVSVNIILS